MLIFRLRIQHLMIDDFGCACSVNVHRQIVRGVRAVGLDSQESHRFFFFFQGFDPLIHAAIRSDPCLSPPHLGYQCSLPPFTQPWKGGQCNPSPIGSWIVFYEAAPGSTMRGAPVDLTSAVNHIVSE